MSIKNLIVKRRIKKYQDFYEVLRAFDRSITEEEADEIMLNVSPKHTKLIKVTDKDEFLSMLTIETYEVLTADPYIYGFSGVYKSALQNIEVVRGEHLKIGEKFYLVNGQSIQSKPSMDPSEKYIIIKQKQPEEFMACHDDYEVIVYEP